MTLGRSTRRARTTGARRPEVVPPVDDLPSGVIDVQVRDVWKGWAYSLEFTVGA